VVFSINSAQIGRKFVCSLLGFILVVVLGGFAPAFAEDGSSVTSDPQFRVAAGLGINYGGYGVNTEYRINQYASIDAGLGYVRHDGPGWAVGAMLYPLKNTKTFNPRLSGSYGRVATVEWNDSVHGHRYEGRNGGTLGGGFEWRVYKQLSLDFDLFYIFKDLPAGVESNSKVGASAGIGLMF
jgi:hypothetical protein